MKEKLIIKNFGPIKSVELEFGRFNVLIGEQASGKSTVAKLLAVCRYFSYIIDNNSSEQAFENGLRSWGLGEAIQDNTSIYYDCWHYSLKVDRRLFKGHGIDGITGESFKHDEPLFLIDLKPKSTEFKGLLAELKKIRPSIFNKANAAENWTIPTSFFQNDVAEIMDNPFYIPVERGLQSVFSLGKNSIQNISDSLFNQFANLDGILRRFGRETDIEPLGIIYKNEQGRGLIRKVGEDVFFTLNNAASGYQSTIPVVLSIRYYAEIRKKKKTFIIEEPELDLFPSAQQKLIQFAVSSVVKFGNSIFLTTHSPYTLTSLNNMMYAFRVGEKHGLETENIIKKGYWINPKDVSAYMLLPDGSCENILDKEEGLIRAEKIDGVSGFLNHQFNELLNLEYNGDEHDT